MHTIMKNDWIMVENWTYKEMGKMNQYLKWISYINLKVKIYAEAIILWFRKWIINIGR